MKCAEIKELLYDFLQGDLEGTISNKVEAHVAVCPLCEAELNDLKKTIHALNKWEVPEASPGFEQRVLKRINEIPIEKEPWGERIKQILKPSFLPVRVAVVTALLVLLVVPIYWIFFARSPSDPQFPPGLSREVKIMLQKAEVEAPIILYAEDTEGAFEMIKGLIRGYQGELLQSLFIKEGMHLTLRLDKDKEEAFFGELSRLGKSRIQKQGYRDNRGNLVILLLKETPPE